jgi:hypothetical protein
LSDLSDIFDMFSQDSDEKKQRKDQEAGAQDKSNGPDTKSLIVNKLTRNKTLLIIIVCIGILVIGALAYFLIGYINNHGIKDIFDAIKPFIK